MRGPRGPAVEVHPWLRDLGPPESQVGLHLHLEHKAPTPFFLGPLESPSSESKGQNSVYFICRGAQAGSGAFPPPERMAVNKSRDCPEAPTNFTVSELSRSPTSSLPWESSSVHVSPTRPRRPPALPSPPHGPRRGCLFCWFEFRR